PEIENKRNRYANKTASVIGGGASAINTSLELSSLQKEFTKTKLIWSLWKKHVKNANGGEEKADREARGELRTQIHSLVNLCKVQVYTPFYTMQVKSMNKQMELIGRYGDEVTTIKGIDELIVNAGNRPDFSIEQELRLSIDPVTESVLDLAPL